MLRQYRKFRSQCQWARTRDVTQPGATMHRPSDLQAEQIPLRTGRRIKVTEGRCSTPTTINLIRREVCLLSIRVFV